MDFTITIEQNIKATSDYMKFRLDFRVHKKRCQHTLDFSHKSWDKRTRIAKAKQFLIELKEKKENSSIHIGEKSTLNQIADMYFLQRPQSEWTKKMQLIYNAHISPTLGEKKIIAIKRVDIDQFKATLQTSGKSLQNKNGCSPRTIQVILKNILKPVMEYALDNDIIEKVPKIEISPVNNKPKPINNPEKDFIALFQAIIELYQDNPFYKGLFLFCLYGRRWGEVRSLKWTDIDFSRNLYTIQRESNKVGREQIYVLPTIIKEALEEFKNVGDYVFTSPISGGMMKDVRAQVEKLKEKSGIKYLTLHTTRHILASLLAMRPDISPTIMAASLGHLNIATATKHYITPNHTTATQAVINVIDEITR